MILGIDEVGRGPWAGPLVVGAVVLGDETIEGLADSKKLSAKRRTELAREIQLKAAAVGLGWVHAGEIDAIGLAAALRLATRRAVEQIDTPYHEIIIDGTINLLQGTSKEAYVTVLPKADALIKSVSAASIVAKVARDEWMADQESEYPEYGFGRHVGYGTAAHHQALTTHGITPLHRRSFAPIAALVESSPSPDTAQDTAHTTAIGTAHEAAVARMLETQGHVIRAMNWRTRWCEIDIISSYSDTTYFTEVRYRSSDTQGDGVASITPDKLRRMRRAAEAYLGSHPKSHNALLQVAAVGRSGDISCIELQEG